MLSDSGLLPVDETGNQFTCFTGTKVRYSVYLLYWYKSTNTDAAAAPDEEDRADRKWYAKVVALMSTQVQ
jgi:hypothetical protein